MAIAPPPDDLAAADSTVRYLTLFLQQEAIAVLNDDTRLVERGDTPLCVLHLRYAVREMRGLMDRLSPSIRAEGYPSQYDQGQGFPRTTASGETISIPNGGHLYRD